MRLFVDRGLAEPVQGDGSRLGNVDARLHSLQRAVIAGLIASESARLAMELVFAHDRERFVDLPERAASAARARLAELESAEADL